MDQAWSSFLAKTKLPAITADSMDFGTIPGAGAHVWLYVDVLSLNFGWIILFVHAAVP